jgi:hypothetical protein
MKRSHRSFLNKSALAITIASMLAAGAYAAFRTRADLRVEAKPAVLGLSTSADGLEAELITITANGFEPAEITRPAGRVVLMFDNQSGKRPIDLRLERTGIPRLSELRLSRKTGATKVLHLPAGDYQVTEADHPSWSLKLTLTRR